MGRKTFAPEQIINKLREAELLLRQRATSGQACKKVDLNARSRGMHTMGEWWLGEEPTRIGSSSTGLIVGVRGLHPTKSYTWSFGEGGLSLRSESAKLKTRQYDNCTLCPSWGLGYRGSLFETLGA